MSSLPKRGSCFGSYSKPGASRQARQQQRHEGQWAPEASDEEGHVELELPVGVSEDVRHAVEAGEEGHVEHSVEVSEEGHVELELPVEVSEERHVGHSVEAKEEGHTVEAKGEGHVAHEPAAEEGACLPPMPVKKSMNLPLEPVKKDLNPPPLMPLKRGTQLKPLKRGIQGLAVEAVEAGEPDVALAVDEGQVGRELAAEGASPRCSGERCRACSPGVRHVGARVDVAAHVVPEAHQADVVEQEAEVPHLPATSAAAPRGSARPGLQRPRATSGQARGSEAELL